VSFSRYKCAQLEGSYFRTHFNNASRKFVTDDERCINCGCSPRVPRINVQVGAADTCFFNTDLDVVGARGGFGALDHLEAWCCGGLE
jgi:hypothetical protein